MQTAMNLIRIVSMASFSISGVEASGFITSQSVG